MSDSLPSQTPPSPVELRPDSFGGGNTKALLNVAASIFRFAAHPTQKNEQLIAMIKQLHRCNDLVRQSERIVLVLAVVVHVSLADSGENIIKIAVLKKIKNFFRQLLTCKVYYDIMALLDIHYNTNRASFTSRGCPLLSSACQVVSAVSCHYEVRNDLDEEVVILQPEKILKKFFTVVVDI